MKALRQCMLDTACTETAMQGALYILDADLSQSVMFLCRAPEEAPQEVKELVDRCLLPEPEQRPDAEECAQILRQWGQIRCLW